jgi:pyridoxamine--pyruvate transaminase
VPDGLTDLQVRDHVRERYGVQLSGGQGAGNLIRIGHLGATARPMFALAGLAALGRALLDLGADVDLGAGLEAAMASLSASGTTSGSTTDRLAAVSAGTAA